jgi:hypothetical protein
MIQFFGQKHPICSEYARFPVPIRAITPITPDQAGEAYRALSAPENIEKYAKKETPYPGAACFYHPPFLADLYAEIGAHIRQFLDFDIVDTYFYARLYDTSNELKIHTDRGSCFVSVSLCLGYDYSPLFLEGSAWPIGVLEGTETGPGKPMEFNMEPGEGVLYPGCSAPHWREMFLGAKCGQAFFHWVPKNEQIFGEYYGDPNRVP